VNLTEKHAFMPHRLAFFCTSSGQNKYKVITYIYIYIYISACIYIYIYISVRVCVYIYIHTSVRMYMYIHRYIHRYIHTYIHTFNAGQVSGLLGKTVCSSHRN
jgi:hypothetical protein